MSIQDLCSGIQLQPQMYQYVKESYDALDFNDIDKFLIGFKDNERMDFFRVELKKRLGEDWHNIKMLCCMLKAAVDIHGLYEEKGIDDTVYFNTMKCFTRFIKECYIKTGEYSFDREWWTARQVGGHLFRIGELEYEMTRYEGRNVIQIHIPSDAVLTPEQCLKSMEDALQFFKKNFIEYKACEYLCRSWLLAPEIRSMLTEDSNIYQFQNNFILLDTKEKSDEFIEWLYHTNNKDYHLFSETTSLQRKVKQYLLSGGDISNPLGKWK